MSSIDDKIALFRTKNFLLRNNDKFPLEQIGLGEFFERLFYRNDELHLQEMGYEHYYDRHYNAIVMTLSENSKGKKVGQNYIVTRELNFADKFWLGDMTITSPITYVGRNRNATNARLCYGIAIDLDGVGETQLLDVLHQQSIGYLPSAHLIVNSGNGLHLYFLFVEPIALFDNTKRLLAKLKHALTERCWNLHTSTIKQKQIQGLFQGFRIPETRTKFGEKVSCFARDEKELPLYRVKDLQKYGPESLLLTDEEIDFLERARYFPEKISLSQAQEMYPDWYERRIVRGEARGRWHIKRDLYDWWLRRMKLGDEVKEGHRYFCMMTLAMYALKCDVPYEELREDAYSLIEEFDAKTQDPENRFSSEDAEDALKAYRESYATFPRDTISKITGVLLLPNKRNKRPQATHLTVARAVRDALSTIKGKATWREGAGRPKGSTINAEKSIKAQLVREWMLQNPGNTNKSQCARETGVNRETVIRWWNDVLASVDVVI